METITYPKKQDWKSVLKRPTQPLFEIEKVVNEVFNEVKNKDDEAIARYTQLFDGVTPDSLLVTDKEFATAEKQISTELKEAIQTAKKTITKFHAAQKTDRVVVETIKGVTCWQEKRAIQKVGLYIPGGSAPLFSTILMLAVPATIAGCKELILCTPPDKKGAINPAILYAAQLCGVTHVYKVGGIQAIAAMTFGTQTIPSVYKIFGPGNQYVTAAKQLATKFNVAIDMPAGPSELLVYADDTANPVFVASDLLSQAEHGPDSQVVLVSTSEKIISETKKEVAKQLKNLPRVAIASEAIKHSKAILIKTESEVIDLINEYAPEHFILISENEEYFLQKIQNAGSVFIGNYTPESAGDYASGTNHTLPTNGYAKQYSGVNLDSFTKSITFQKISKEGIKNLGNTIELMAEAEGLQAHKNAVSIRLKSLKQ
ncbi:histidinol dehydrogenase [Marixanthomonas sp. SCSIO 43207]|uniref:histidinol dehydrogenase n=1 Tax=Marixanthomonas sp. SCSIO 43207 TaxID=2779360 RepID=UPI001CA97227|nr:histidinol dehydrogenase [Marixanthomonas sp. SCSIO 43207]UAB80701.1 histidinol dehydrogenase [Marixanthomonas sp. SCSIO 43207]